ncbi:MAG: multicopper oxidase domain-containing protein [Fluviicola sp.]|nr:multicopper oxidase domain-containing protein [Fluviicola sp.]
MNLSKQIFVLVVLFQVFDSIAQNQLVIPPTLSGTTFNLSIQTGNVSFFNGTNTPTYGVNGAILGPTLIVNKNDDITLNVTNNLPVNTTMHWHGLHLPAMMDGGPHQIITPNNTWSPSFKMLNNAGTFWYHPHGLGKTDLHVSKGIAGFIIVHEPFETSLGVPLTYGVDDFPLVVQTKAFDVLTQIAISSEMDTAIFVNGTYKPNLNVPAQVVRLRLLNGSSMRSYYFGFSNGMDFYQITTDGGYKDIPAQMNRILLSPGERADILINLSSLNGQSFDLNSFASEMPNGIFGAAMVGVAPDTIMGYSENHLNGSDFPILHFNVVNQSSNPISSIPASLVPFTQYSTQDVNENRVFEFDTITTSAGMMPNLAEGQFGINRQVMDMDSINVRIPLNSTEIWTLINKTHIAHPFHIHDIQFNVIEKNGTIPDVSETGWKDVVLVMPHDSVKFITKFTDFADDMTPYMYHCHILHHEDDGMMGTFIVYDSTSSVNQLKSNQFSIYPNPTLDEWLIQSVDESDFELIEMTSISGQKVNVNFEKTISHNEIRIDARKLERGYYFLKVKSSNSVKIIKLQKV